MREVICIVCPKGCHLIIEESGSGEYIVAGGSCEKGTDYGISEVTNPVHVLTLTVKIEGSDLVRCPVRTDGFIPKEKIFECMEEINDVTLHTPVKVGDMVIDDLADTGVALKTTRSDRRMIKRSN